VPKIVDHEQRRDEIALVACRVVAEFGFDQATIVRIAREAGYTTGMVAHYFDTKQEIIIAALRLILRRIEERLTAAPGADPQLLALLAEALPVDATRFTECAFWAAFWGQVSADRRLKRINAWMHREYLKLFERCLARGWSEWRDWTAPTREQVLRSVVTFINGLTASVVASPGDWPAARQIEQLRLQLTMLHAWASGGAVAALPRRGRRVAVASPRSASALLR
jgi:TetR/AcrR family transcriptional regulator, transcriptional repressor of bet genes